nr:uncharacterized protein LOC112015972 [Quercus suber]
MKVLSWNCRGMGSPSAVLQCQKNAQVSRPDIIFLMETWLRKDKGKQLLEKCGFMEGWEVPREGLSGGLLLGWMSPYKLSIQYSSNHLIHANLLDNRGIRKFLTTTKVKGPVVDNKLSINSQTKIGSLS